MAKEYIQKFLMIKILMKLFTFHKMMRKYDKGIRNFSGPSSGGTTLVALKLQK